jgi:predicted nucleotide-binding protein
MAGEGRARQSPTMLGLATTQEHNIWPLQQAQELREIRARLSDIGGVDRANAASVSHVPRDDVPRDDLRASEPGLALEPMDGRGGDVVIVGTDNPRALRGRPRTARPDRARPRRLQQHHDRRVDPAAGRIEPRHRLAAAAQFPQFADPHVQRRHVRLVQPTQLPFDHGPVAVRLWLFECEIPQVHPAIIAVCEDGCVPYHVMIWPASAAQRQLHELYAVNVNENQLRERFIEPYDHGRPITWNGRTLPAGDISYIRIFESDQELAVQDSNERVYNVITQYQEATNDWITGEPGQAAERQNRPAALASPAADPKRVMIVHGRNGAVRDAMATFLRALGLAPIEWEQAIKETGMGTPHNFDAVRAAMDVAQAVVVVLTAEDQAGILPAFSGRDKDDERLQGQPRQNVILEAGMAMGIDRSRTILVEVGPIRRASDFEGMNVVRIDNAPATRASLRSRLINAGCSVDQSATDYLNPGAGGDFESTVAPWTPIAAPQPDSEWKEVTGGQWNEVDQEDDPNDWQPAE